ncbi:MAG: beta-lactamase family protein [Ruminococcus sp.]|uniref:serine hydrolase domain-containing protein n=1 Tax=Ruminococcus sp. TaxID=41978 RepID=UPI0025FE645B|nr:serine hydrolase domain-containing protein [Ruminococcus sp.]MCR5601181.1 beta-lactamase family protein [Ruminococcus sp.]
MNKIVKASAIITAFLTVPAVIAAAPIKADNVGVNKKYESHDTLSCVGSVSKMFVTTAVMQLAEQGRVDIDAPVTEYLPDFRMADERYRDITVRMLMNHTSGIMGTTEGDFMLYNDRDALPHDNFLNEMRVQRLKADPGDFGAYCNDGFELLELIVEQVSGKSFTDYVEEHICKPLGMSQTGTPWNAFRTPEHVEVFKDGNVRLVPDYCMDIGSGGILSTAPEICTFGTAFFKGDNRLLSEKSKKEMSETKVTDKYEDGFGLGWDQVDYDDYKSSGVKVISKGGAVIHQFAELLVAPDEEISVSVLSSGGGSMGNIALSQVLMDIALEEKGIKIEHSKPKNMETLEEVPEKYLSYARIYGSSESVCIVSFPDGKYMEIKDISGDKVRVTNYKYTTDDKFVLMSGNIVAGKAVQDTQQTLLSFCQRDGRDYICQDINQSIGGEQRYAASSYMLQRLEPNNVSSSVQSAWDKRSGKKYYFYNGKYSNVMFNEMPSIKMKTFSELGGYFSTNRIIDEKRAESAIVMPGGRDLRDIEFSTENGAEYMKVTNCAMEFISEDAIPELKNDISEVKLSTKKASWFSIGSAANMSINLDIPENAAVYVYDKYDNMTYSSYMTEYGSNVPLPQDGKIVFLGEDGGKVSISQ